MAGFSGINVALQTLLAQQAALEITQNNVANANTEGYHRQEAVMKAGYPTRSMAFTNSAGVQNIGTGVYVSTIKRYSLDFYETQYRNQLSQNSKYNMLADMLTEIEINLGDSSSDGITDRINNFFAGWQTVATDPDIAANREDLLETARALVEGFNDRASSLIRIQQDQNVAIKQRVDDVNSIAAQLAKLNAEIGRSQTETTDPNALFDERDRLLDQLATNIGTIVHIQDDGQVLVSIQGHAMVIGSRNFELEATPVASNNNLVQINWADDSTNTALEIQSGEIAGIMYARDVVIEDQLSRLDDSVTSLANRVNAIHRSGFNLIKPIPDTVDPTLITNLDAITGIDFFSLTSSSISLSGALNSYEGIGGTYDIAVDVLDGESASRQVTLRFIKTQANEWEFTTISPSGASIVSGEPPIPQPGTVTFDASGNFASSSGSILLDSVTTAIDLSSIHQAGVASSGLSIDNRHAALSIRMNSLIEDYNHIAAATEINAPGDGNNALAIANSVDSTTLGLANGRDPVMENGMQSIRHYNTSRITQLALEQRSSETGAADTSNIMLAMDDQRESVAGVNLDEEAANMVKYQRAYQAATRLMNTFDEMLELIVTSLGLVGR